MCYQRVVYFQAFACLIALLIEQKIQFKEMKVLGIELALFESPANEENNVVNSLLAQYSKHRTTVTELSYY